jgi:hypothetical protein
MQGEKTKKKPKAYENSLLNCKAHKDETNTPNIKRFTRRRRSA